MDRSRIPPPLSVVALLMLAGCQVYEPRPLDPEAVVAAVERERREATVEGEAGGTARAEGARDQGVTLAEAAAWMRRLGPDVRDAVAAWRTALARARVETPFPNPGLEVGPEYGFGADVSDHRWAPFVAIGITLPLGDRLACEDDLNQVRAEVARLDGVARHRELYLELRRRWLRLVGIREIESARKELVLAATRSVALTRRVVEAGKATALDVALLELERGRSEAARLDVMAEEVDAEAALAALVGVDEEHFGHLADATLPALPAELPTRDFLREELVAHHPGLARIRARYEEAEAALRLEIARQYPDLQIGPSFAKETGERKTTLGLVLGIELPLFDRNQQAIAEAEERREEVRRRYEAEASRALAALEGAWRAARVARLRHRVRLDTVLPQARSSTELARQSLAAGATDALRLLEAERSYRAVLIEVLQAGLDEAEAWMDLELAVGRPLVLLPSETMTGAPETPPALRPETPAMEEER